MEGETPSADEEDSGGSGETESTSTRHPYTNDAAALLTVAGSLVLLGAAGFGAADLSRIPGYVVAAVWAPTLLTAVVWLYGAGAAKAAKGLLGGGE